MSLNYSFIDENESTKNNYSSTKKEKPAESLAEKVKRRIKRKMQRAPTANYEVFEDDDSEILGNFDSDEGHKEMSKMDAGSGALHKKPTTGPDHHGKQPRTEHPVVQPEYTKHYGAPNFDAIMQSNSANKNTAQTTNEMTHPSPALNNGYSGNPNQELLRKLNYLIHLLEDQKDERLGSITEELVLYCFLGVFIIFVLDSFVKVGKYVR